MRFRLLIALVTLIDACRSDALNRRYAQPLRSLLHRQLLPTSAEPQPPGVLGRNRLQRLRGGGVSSAPLLIGIDGGTESIRGNVLMRKSMRRLWERDSDCSMVDMQRAFFAPTARWSALPLHPTRLHSQSPAGLNKIPATGGAASEKPFEGLFRRRRRWRARARIPRQRKASVSVSRRFAWIRHAVRSWPWTRPGRL